MGWIGLSYLKHTSFNCQNNQHYKQNISNKILLPILEMADLKTKEFSDQFDEWLYLKKHKNKESFSCT